MLWLLLLVFLVGSCEASLLPKISSRRLSSVKNVNFKEAKELLTRFAYTSQGLDPLPAHDLMSTFASEIVKSQTGNQYCDPLLMIAVAYNNPVFVRNWIQLGFPVNTVSWDNRNAWHCYRQVNPEIRNMLKAAAVPKTLKENLYHTTPLSYLWRHNHFEAVTDLIKSETFTEKDLSSEEFDEILKKIKSRKESFFN